MSIFFPFFFFVCLLNFKQQFLRENCFVVKKNTNFFQLPLLNIFVLSLKNLKSLYKSANQINTFHAEKVQHDPYCVL